MAQTLKFGNGNFATKAGSTLCYDDQNGNFKPIPMDFSRNSIGTRVNKQGLIEVMQADIPRIDYTDTDKGVLLLENSSTNLVTYSEDFSNAFWTKSNSSIVSNNAISPDGTSNASKLVENTSNTEHICFNQQTGVSKTFSFFAKSAGNQYVAISYNGGTSFNFFDIVNGVLGNIADSSHTSKIEDYGNGWFRCSMFNGHSNFGATIWMSKDGTNTSYQGDGSSGVYIYGAQLEQGNLSSYIPTSGSAVQRAADSANNAGNSEVFSDSEGVLYADIGSFVGADDYRQISISDGSVSDYILIGLRNDTGNIYFDSSSSNTVITNIKPINSFSKCAFKYELNNFSFWANGFKVGVDTSTSVLSGLNTLNFDIIGVNEFYGKTKEIGYYDEILTDSELEYLTSYRSLSELVKELNLNTL